MATMKFITGNCNNKMTLMVLILLIMTLGTGSHAENPSRIELLKSIKKPQEKPKYRLELKKADNEIETTVAFLFLGYKTFLSSQDMNSCVFSPTCSVYAMEAFQKFNPVKAYLMTFDRLTRCHPLSKPGQYPLTSNLYLYDPVY